MHSFAVRSLIFGRYKKTGSMTDELDQRVISMFACCTCISCWIKRRREGYPDFRQISRLETAPGIAESRTTPVYYPEWHLP